MRYRGAISWDHEFDVVVIGSGTGLLAAVRAADAGLKSAVLEKLPTLGGTTRLSGGGIWIPNNYCMQAEEVEDSLEDALEYMKQVTFGQSEPELMEAYLANCNALVTYTRELGIEWCLFPGGMFPDYYEEFPGSSTYGRAILPVSKGNRFGNRHFGEAGGNDLVLALEKAGRERGVRYMTETAAERLIVDHDDRVVGVLAVSGGKELCIRALRGVVMASGGFSRNDTMVMSFLRAPIYYPSTSEGDTGDGHRMGMELGADLRNMNESWGMPVYWDPSTKTAILSMLEIGKPACIVVNRKGERFFNEAGPYARVIRAFEHFDPALLEYSNVPAFAIIDSTFRWNYPFAGYEPKMNLPKWITQADTLEELAQKLGIDAKRLVETVSRFNLAAATGKDPDWHRGESAYDQQTVGDSSRGLPNSCLAPLTEPPYFGVALWPGVIGTKGGLRINANAQVMHVWNKPIAGLYAVGNCTGSVMGAGYPGGGSTIGAGMVFGYIAVNHMARADSPDKRGR